MSVRHAVHALVPASLLACLLALSWGCSGSSPAGDPVIRRNFERLADLIAEVQADLDDQQDSLNDITDQMDSLRTRSGGASAAEITALRSSNQQLSEQVAALQDQFTTLTSNLEEIEHDWSVSALGTRGSRTLAESSRSSTRSGTSRLGSQQRRVHGFWHEYASSDSLDAIARRYHTDVDAILEANALPRNAHLYPGQQLFIPQGN